MINIKDDRVISAFGERLRSLRVKGGLTQQKLANLADIELSQVGRIERGETNLTLSTMNALATALNIPIGDFFKQD